MDKLIFLKISFNEFKGVLIDIDNTIYHYESCHKLALNSLLKELFKNFNLSLETIKHEFLNARKK